MKRVLLFSFFIFCGVVLYAQSKTSFRTSQKLEKFSLQIYPNPVSTSFGISSDPGVVENIMVFNLVGRKLKSFKAVKGKKYYVGDLPKGLYLVQLLGKQNKILTTKRVSKR